MSFKDDVFRLVSKIPRGKVLTYKAVAELIGRMKAYRAVGNVLNRNRNPKVYCHRVVRSGGGVGGYARGTASKIRILKNEGIEVIDGKVDLSKYLWNDQSNST